MDFRPGYREQSSGKLQEYLAKPCFDLDEFLAIPGILGDIKTNIGKFIKYLSTRKKLTMQLVHYATRLNQSQLQEESKKKFCFIAIEILCNEDDELVELFFRGKDDKEDQKISQEISAHNEIEQLLFSDDEIIPDGQDPFDPSQVLEYFLNYLYEANLQNTAQNNYFSKVMISMIRKTGLRFLAFIINHPKYIDKIIENLNELALGTILIKLLVVDTEDSDKKGITLAQCREIKLYIVKKLQKTYLDNLSDAELCQSIGLLIQQGFQTIRNKFFEFPEDLVTSFNILVNEESVKIYLEKLLTATKNNEFATISMLITLILRKLNRQVQEFYEGQRDKKNLKQITQSDYILKFQIEALIINFSEIINLLHNPIFTQNSNLNKHRFTSFLVQLIKVQKLWASQLNFKEIIPFLLTNLNKYCGVLQNDFFSIAKTFIEKCPDDILESFPEKIYEPIIDTKEIEISNSLHHTSGLGPNLELVLLIHSRNQNFISAETLNKYGIDLQKVIAQHSFVLGGSEPHTTKNTHWVDYEGEQPVRIFDEPLNSGSREEGQNKIMVGNKKNIVLPNLRYISEKRKAKQEERTNAPQTEEQLEECIREQKQNVIEIQEQQFIVSIPIRFEEPKIQEEIPEIRGEEDVFPKKQLAVISTIEKNGSGQIEEETVQLNKQEDKQGVVIELTPQPSQTHEQVVTNTISSSNQNLQPQQEPSREQIVEDVKPDDEVNIGESESKKEIPEDTSAPTEILKAEQKEHIQTKQIQQNMIEEVPESNNEVSDSKNSLEKEGDSSKKQSDEKQIQQKDEEELGAVSQAALFALFDEWN